MNVLGAMAKLTFGALAKAAGAEIVVDAARGGIDLWKGHFTSHGEALSKAMERATTDAFKALDIALDGSAWLRSANLKEHGQAMRQWLESLPLPAQTDREAFLAACRADLKATRKRDGFGKGDPDLAGLIGRAPSADATLEQEALAELAREADAAGCTSLAHLFRAPVRGTHILTEASRFFLLQAISAEESLCRVFQLQRIDELERGQGAVLTEIRLVQRKQDDVLVQIQTLLDGKDLGRRAVRAFDSMSFRNGRERELVRKIRDAIRTLPESARESLELQKDLGKLLHGSEQFDDAEEAFAAALDAAGGSSDRDAKAEAHFSRFHNALQRKDHETALFELNAAAELRADLYRLVPTGYVAEKILGAGGFGVAILCQHPHLKKKRVIKALFGEEGDADQVFAEAGHLADLDHEHIIKVFNCAYVDPQRRERPYLELEHFDGCDLETYVNECFPLPEGDFQAIASGIAQALHYAHGRSPRILHRDVKPSNVLVAKSNGRMLVKLIDFGLAVEQRLRDDAIRLSLTGNSLQAQTTVGTLDYAAPEQLGKITGATPGPYSDVYGFARTCCYVLFKKTLPTQKNWKQVPESLSELLDNCLEEQPQERLPDFGAVFEAWEAMTAPTTEAEPPSLSTPSAPSTATAPPPSSTAKATPTPASGATTTSAPNDYEALGRRTFKGLESLGKNEFGLHEFWMPSTGAKPVRGKDAQFRIEDGTGMVFVMIPGGTYTIGAQKTDPGGKHYDALADDDESPVHTVQLDPYFLTKYAMTQGQWQKATGENPSANYRQKNGRERPLAHPVENVSWEECTDLLGKLGLALPTEAQWEAAARAGTTTPWWCGANEASMKGVIRYGDSSQGHAPVDWSRPNPFGLYNVLGNVWEWCRDGYGTYATAPQEGDAERLQQGSADRANRGGSFSSVAQSSRAAGRYYDTPGFRGGLGCRPARGLSP